MQTPIPSSFRFFKKNKKWNIAVSRENPGHFIPNAVHPKSRFAHIPILLGSYPEIDDIFPHKY